MNDDYEIITTLGPSSRTPRDWGTLVESGASGFRLNTSHLGLEELSAWLEQIARFRAGAGCRVPLTLDLQGSKWRLGEFLPQALRVGEVWKFDHANGTDQPQTLPVPHADFFCAAPCSNGVIILDDAKIRFDVVGIEHDHLSARVIQGGMISAHKGITFGESDFRVETISAKDRQIMRLAAGDPLIRLAISYVRDGHEMENYRLATASGVKLVAKLERRPALTDVAAIARGCDELWLCRGDLGAELGFNEMARAVAQFTAQLPALSIPVLMAGQVLEHMTGSITPTRSEVCYLWDTLQAGYQGFVLSDEVAVGKYPLESCRAAAIFKSIRS